MVWLVEGQRGDKGPFTVLLLDGFRLKSAAWMRLLPALSRSASSVSACRHQGFAGHRLLIARLSGCW